VCYHDASEVKTGRTQLAHGHMARCGLWTFYRWCTLEPDIQRWWTRGSSCLNVAQTTVPLKYCDFYVKNISINNLANVIQLRLPGGTITYTTSAFEKVNVNTLYQSFTLMFLDIYLHCWLWCFHHLIMTNVTWQHFGQSAKHLTVGHATSHTAQDAFCQPSGCRRQLDQKPDSQQPVRIATNI